MNEFKAKTFKDLKTLGNILDGPVQRTHVTKVDLSLTDDSILHHDFNDLLWFVLSHPRSKISELRIDEGNEDVLGDLGMMKIVERWCREVPAESPRKISLAMHSASTETMQEILDDFRQALTSPGNGVKELNLENISSDSCFFGLLLGPVLESPNNELAGLSFGEGNEFGEDEDDAPMLVKGFASPYCKLHSFEIDMQFVPFVTVLSILEGLSAVNSLERLILKPFDCELTGEEKGKLMRKLARLIKRPGNALREIKWELPNFDRRQISILVQALTDEHCRLVELACGDALQMRNVALPLFDVLRRPDIRLKTLRGIFCGKASCDKLKESLQNENCQLETLALVGDEGGEPLLDEGVVTAIAIALESARCSRLKTLCMGHQTPDVFPVFTKSLRSYNNKLTELILDGADNLDKATLCDFYRAIRISNIVHFEDFRYGSSRVYGSFRDAFNSRFFQVMHTLLSVMHLPRLGHSCWFSLLPVKDFILTIAETLGWPLNDLRV